MYFISCSQKTRKKGKEVTQEITYLGKTPSLEKTPINIRWKEQSATARSRFSADTRIAASRRSCLCQPSILHAGPDGDDFSLGSWPASTSLSRNKSLVSFLTRTQRDEITPWLIKSMLIGDAFQTSMPKLTRS